MATGFNVMDALNKNSKEGLDESPKARFRTKDVSIFKMYRNKMNFYSLQNIEALAGEILMFGLKQNLEIAYEPCSEGEYRIVAGERRWLALQHLVSKGHKEYEIATCKLTTPQDADEEQVEIIIANGYRDKTAADMIEEERRLKESLERMKAAGKTIKGYDLQKGRLRDVIANMLKVSKTKVAQIESVNNNLIPEFREELSKERMTFSAAYELSGMTADEQREALSTYMDTGELSLKDVKEMKEAKQAEKEGEQFKGQLQYDDEGNVIKDASGQQVSESDTGAAEEYETPHPEGITSLCYGCQKYMDCNVKTGTCTKCDQYVNKAEAEKTDEQRYDEEQARIDKETAAKLREKEDEEKMNNLPSDRAVKKVDELEKGTLLFIRYTNDESTVIPSEDYEDYTKNIDGEIESVSIAEEEYATVTLSDLASLLESIGDEMHEDWNEEMMYELEKSNIVNDFNELLRTKPSYHAGERINAKKI